MLKRFHDRFGTAGVVIGVIALVLALVTGAYAAGGGLSGKQKKEVEKIAKKYAGKPGAAGAQGPQGSPGPAGANGKDGTNGTNGEPGEPGETGFTATLPSGQTETGVWTFGFEPTGRIEVGEEEYVPTLNYTSVPLSFPIPLVAGLPDEHAIILAKGEEGTVHQTECPGSVGEPKAESGYLCVYTGFPSTPINVEPVHDPERPSGAFGKAGTAGRSGAVLLLQNEQGAAGSGTWAVTAE